ncbi:MAG: FAD-dependent oxidoreductase [Hyphomicrobium sp.]|uniref:dihydrolipoyl dehydrogenase family protein n=1 Tax=Hyphomicrobium sp. TaxID=82 RepID=UPI0025BA5910|nr:FAD-dependent oxidoreductase [Hyphomicrobium sp.]MBX9863878.1 FAD-dependent oxidoreductase [Hyphomicrobium sp.]
MSQPPRFTPQTQRSPESGGGGAPSETTGDVHVAGEPLEVDICVIGAGAGGLAVATAAAAFGRRVVLVEKQKMGGSGLHAGCVPGKALIASGRRAHAMRTAGAFGIAPVEPQIDLRAVSAHVRGIVSTLAPNASLERMTGLGVRVILAAGRFLDKRTLLAGDYRITARRFVIATGSSSTVPPIEGLEGCPFYTDDTIGEVDRKVTHLVVIGGGATGLELAQAHLRLGARATVIDGARALGRDDPEAASVVVAALRSEGVDIREGTKVERVEKMAGFVRVHVSTIHGFETVDASHLVIAVGRTPNLSDLNLAAAGIKHTRNGIAVNRGFRTSNRRIYAIGDVNGSAPSNHSAAYQAEVVLKRALFWLPAKANKAIVPSVTMTDPELAQVGMSEDEARAARHRVHVLRWPFSEVDRAQIDRTVLGHAKIVTSSKGQVLGATIVGPSASELIQVWSLAVAEKLHVKAMAAHVAPYPSLGEVSKRAAVRHFSQLPGNPKTRRIIDLLSRLG